MQIGSSYNAPFMLKILTCLERFSDNHYVSVSTRDFCACFGFKNDCADLNQAVCFALRIFTKMLVVC